MYHKNKRSSIKGEPEFHDFFRRDFSNLLIVKAIIFLISEHRCPFGCSWPLALIPFRSLKRIVDHSSVRFPPLQFQNSPFGLRHWICGRFGSLRIVTKNSLMFAPGISATTRQHMRNSYFEIIAQVQTTFPWHAFRSELG